MPFRRDGKQAVNDMGAYTFSYRAKILKRLLEVQHELQKRDNTIKLVSDQELIAIQVNWYRDFNFGYQVSDIYNSIYNDSFIMESNTRNQLLRLFKAVKPHGVEIKDVVVNYNIERRPE